MFFFSLELSKPLTFVVLDISRGRGCQKNLHQHNVGKIRVASDRSAAALESLEPGTAWGFQGANGAWVAGWSVEYVEQRSWRRFQVIKASLHPLWISPTGRQKLSAQNRRVAVRRTCANQFWSVLEVKKCFALFTIDDFGVLKVSIHKIPEIAKTRFQGLGHHSPSSPLTPLGAPTIRF